MIKIKDLKKSYTIGSENHNILESISLDVPKGKWCTIIGPSGTGKSTFLNCIAGLSIPDYGEVLYEDINIYNMKENVKSEYRKNNIGFVFQDFKLLPHYSVIDNVALPMIYDRAKNELYLKAKELLGVVGIEKSLFNRLPESLSGGEKQRVAIARSLIANPKVLICDEPTGNLDIENRNNILEILTEFKNKGQTIIMVTHDEEVARRGDITFQIYKNRLQTYEVNI